jgi:release factor glutamine methyltransferase
VTTIRDALQQAAARLTPRSPSPRLDAEALLAHVLQRSRAWLLAESQQPLTPAQQASYAALIERRAALEPVAYLTEHKEFYGLDFYVDRRVLVPRPETELLIELALQWAGAARPQPLSIADIGTGSGCLAVTLALRLPQTRVFAVDLSADALAVAAINVERHAVGERVALLQGDGCMPLPQPVSLIVANPPYTVLDEVDENVRRWEPHLALDGGAERGFAAVERLLRQMPGALEPHGAALIEIGAWQGAQARQAAQTIFADAQIRLHQDLAGLDRALAVYT